MEKKLMRIEVSLAGGLLDKLDKTLLKRAKIAFLKFPIRELLKLRH
jgi:hypothetical protein